LVLTRSKKVILFSVVAVVIILLIVASAFMNLEGSSQPSSTPTPPPATPTPTVEVAQKKPFHFGVTYCGNSTSEAKQLVDKSFLKKLVRAFLILVFLIILTFIAFRLFRTLQEDDGVVVRPPGISPSPIPYQPYKPSIYAGDPEVLQLEEDINILEAELTNTNIREEQLFPPSLDFNVKF